MNIYEFIYKLEDKGLKAVNFDEKELVIPEKDGLPPIPLQDDDGVGVIKMASRRKIKELTDLKYYIVLNNSSSLPKIKPLLENFFINDVYAMNDGAIIVLITNENSEKIKITDIGLDNQFVCDNGLDNLIQWFNTPISDDEELSADAIDKYLNQKTVDKIKDEVKAESTPKLQAIAQPVTSFGNKVILVIDRLVKEDRIRQAYAAFRNRDQYRNSAVYNFYALLDDDGNSYMLQCIDLIEKMKLEPEKQIELYTQFQNVCKAWFDKVKSLGVTDICCRRVFNTQRTVTPETVIWLWGYFVIGQKCNWILSDGFMVRAMKNEFLKDIKSSAYYGGEAKRILEGDRDYVVSLPHQYMSLGCANHMIDIGQKSKTEAWKSDNISFESHIAGAMGSYNRVPNNKSLQEQINSLLNLNRTNIYKEFIKRYYNI